MSNVIPFHYQGQPVRFNSDGWINATDIAAGHGLRLDNWLRNKETEAYIAALARHLNTSDSGFDSCPARPQRRHLAASEARCGVSPLDFA
ncbi:KilA-N domain-containing protein [Azotobacter chroococcum]